MQVGLSIIEMIKEYFTSCSWIPICVISLFYCYWRMTTANRKKTRIVGIILVVCIFNDFVKTIFEKIFNEGTFYRFLWMIPLTIIVSYMITDIIARKERRTHQILIVALVFGGTVLCSDNWIKEMNRNNLNNIFLLSNETQYIIQTITEDTDADRIPVVLPGKYETEVRALDARLVTAITRNAYIDFFSNGPSELFEAEDVLIQVVNYGVGIEIQKVRQALKEREVQYIVIDTTLGMHEYLTAVGCTFVGSYNTTCIYRVDCLSSVENSGEMDLDKTDCLEGDSVYDELLLNNYLTNVNEIHIRVPGLKKSYTYCVWNDTHLWAKDDDPNILEEQRTNVSSRIANFCVNEYGIPSRTTFQEVMKRVDEMQVDGLILNGDIIDQMSVDNLSFVKNNLEQINTPYMYLRSDHDILCEWTECDMDLVRNMEEDMNLLEEIYVMEEDEFIILGINNSFMNISDDALAKIRNIFAEGKPIIIVTHVPYDSIVDCTFASTVEEDRGKKLIWGENCYYIPDENMKEYLNMIYDDNSPVVAVISAHLHKEYTISLTDQVVEYVLSPGKDGNITRITIDSE